MGRRKFGLVVALVAVALGVMAFTQLGGQAQDKKTDKKDDKATPAKGATGAVTFEEIGKILDNLGYEPELKDTRYDCKSTELTFSVSLSGNKANIWFQASLVNVPDPAPTDRLQKLLESDFKYGKTAFRFWPQANRILTLEMPLENIAITPARFRKGADEFLMTAKATENIWRGDWSKAPGPDVKPKTPAADSASPFQQPQPVKRK